MRSVAIALSLVLGLMTAPLQSWAEPDDALPVSAAGSYILGEEDLLTIRVMDVEEMGASPYMVDLRGNVDLPRVGEVRAAGLTVQEFQMELVRRYRKYLKRPQVLVSITEYHSKPVSVLGEVGSPGVRQIRGRRNLLEILSDASGLKQDAGGTIEVTRRKIWGPIPLPSNHLDPSGEFYTAHASVRSLMTGEDPRANIQVMPNDVLTVPKAEMVYVLGSVKRSGGFVLSERSDISILEALSLAEGLDRTAGAKHARVLRAEAGSTARREIPVDVKKLMAGEVQDMRLFPNDILFIPNSPMKIASQRAIEAVVSAGTGLAIYRPY